MVHFEMFSPDVCSSCLSVVWQVWEQVQGAFGGPKPQVRIIFCVVCMSFCLIWPAVQLGCEHSHSPSCFIFPQVVFVLGGPGAGKGTQVSA